MIAPGMAALVRPPGPGDLYFDVRLRLLLPEEGGRHHGIGVGYRASWFLDLEDETPTEIHDAPITAMVPEAIEPGAQAVATIRPIAVDFWRVVGPGREIQMREGPRTVGLAVVASSLRQG